MIDQPQFDGYHQHPVDIHSIKTLKFSQNIEDECIKNIFNELSNEQKNISKDLLPFSMILEKEEKMTIILLEKTFQKYDEIIWF